MIWLFGALTLGSALAATFVGDIRRAILFLWVSGLGAAGLFLTVGAEVLAIIQCIAATLLAIAFFLYAITFGEYGLKDSRTLARRVIAALVPSILGIAFAGVIWLGASQLPTEVAPQMQDISKLGATLVHDHILSLEILAITLFLVVVGAGAVARPEGPEA